MIKDFNQYIVLDENFNFHGAFFSKFTKSDFAEVLFGEVLPGFYYILDFKELCILNRTPVKYMSPDLEWRCID